MKRWLGFTAVITIVAAGLVASQMKKPGVMVSPRALLYLVADTQKELSRVPMSLTRLGDEDEIRIGNNIAKSYRSPESERNADAAARAVQAYVERVGMRVAGRAERKLPYRFHYLPDPDFVNAFALPGGHVFIGGGLLALMDSEDELASVLGHEIEHIDRRHCAERLQASDGGLLADIYMAGYSKDQELEADRDGTQLAVWANYSPLGALRMFETFDRLYQEHIARAKTPQEELTRVAVDTLSGYFRSHPPTPERINQIRTMISEKGWESRTEERPLEVAYVFWTERAGQLVRAGKYPQAEALATRSLAQMPDQKDALVALAEAQFGLGNFGASAETYKKIVAKWLGEGETVGSFAEQLAASALGADHHDDAEKFAAGCLVLQPKRAGALLVLAEAQYAKGDYVQASATYDTVKSLYPNVAERVSAFVSQRSSRFYAQHDYERAESLAAHMPGGTREEIAKNLYVLAESQFALAHFPSAAATYRRLLQLKIDQKTILSYAAALSATDRLRDAAKEFDEWSAGRRGMSADYVASMRVELSGLWLRAGNERLADSLAGEAGLQGSAMTPQLTGRLGWWYYRAGKIDKAAEIGRRAAEGAPGDAELLNRYAWIVLERNGTEAASSLFSEPMGQAVVQWRAGKRDKAIEEFRKAVDAQPEWLNPRWVKPFYSPGVVKTIAEMTAERTRRLEAEHAKHPATSGRPRGRN